jgi:voltage-gated potassium channel Kch
MAVLVRLVTGGLFVLFVWGAGWLADYLTSSGRLTAFTVLAFLPIIGLWFIVLFVSLLPAIAIYAPELNHRIRTQFLRLLAIWNPNKFQILYYVALSYVMSAYLFSVIFKAISNLDETAFNPPIKALSTAAYFSVVTIATVGYGDIVPVSAWARFMASAEILIGVAYGVFFFAVIAGFLREDRS